MGMDLQQEYFQRHQIVEPIVRYADRGHVICRHQTKGEKGGESRLTAFSFVFNRRADHPPYFKMTRSDPYKDTQQQPGPGTLRVAWDKKVEFDDWDDFVNNWCQETKGQVEVVPQEDITLAVWEMFIYNHDHWLSQNLPGDLYDMLVTVIDEEADKNDRLVATKAVENWLLNRNRQSHGFLTALLTNYDQQHWADWMASRL